MLMYAIKIYEIDKRQIGNISQNHKFLIIIIQKSNHIHNCSQNCGKITLATKSKCKIRDALLLFLFSAVKKINLKLKC